MFVGRSCSERGRSESGEVELDVEGFWEGVPLGTRLYFVLLGLVSAVSSARKELSSFSAISSRESGLGCDGSGNEGVSEGKEALGGLFSCAA
jgi:hypothetical protein